MFYLTKLCSFLCLSAVLLLPAGVSAQVNFGAWAGGSAAKPGTPSTTAAQVRTDHLLGELLAHAPQGVGPGKSVWLGFRMTHKPQWHTYWLNPGDSGLPTRLEWTLPAGLSAGEIVWPVPKKIPIGPLMNYGYEDSVMLLVPLTVSAYFKPPLLAKELDVKLQASWLVCHKECIPEEGSLALKLPLSGVSAHASAFDAALNALPKALAMPAGVEAGGGPAVGGTTRARADGQTLVLQIDHLPVNWRGQNLELFTQTPELIEHAGALKQSWRGGSWSAQLPLSPQRVASPATVPLLLVGPAGEALTANLAFNGAWPAKPQAASDVATHGGARAVGAPPQGAAPLGFWAALLGAVLGGLILNLMPCVFPVLAIKVLSFAKPGQAQRGHRVQGLAYSAGVMLSFAALGGLLLALRAGGEAVGWGFQLQSPLVVAGLALLFTLIGLNLSGLFEMGSFLPSSVATLQARHPAGDAFLTGVLAVAIASPCTAPFMGASIGLAATLPTAQALAVFVAVGFGLALPYLLASWFPAFARALPKPGAWMEVLRRALAFPMFATVVWLVWVLGQQTGIDGAAALLVLLVLLAMVLWSWTLKGRTRLVLVLVSGLGLSLLTFAIGPRVLQEMPLARSASAPAEGWLAWEPGLVEQTLSKGQPVLVDFTAAWCVTCQFNKKTVLASTDVLAALRAKNVTLLRADWTRRDPAITAALAQLGRSGVPVYALFAPGRAPVILSELPSVQEIQAAAANL